MWVKAEAKSKNYMENLEKQRSTTKIYLQDAFRLLENFQYKNKILKQLNTLAQEPY